MAMELEIPFLFLSPSPSGLEACAEVEHIQVRGCHPQTEWRTEELFDAHVSRGRYEGGRDQPVDFFAGVLPMNSSRARPGVRPERRGAGVHISECVETERLRNSRCSSLIILKVRKGRERGGNDGRKRAS